MLTVSASAPLHLQDFLETLEDLDLSYNNLVDIPWETIALLVSVNTLSLDHNLIESVPEGIFSNLHKLARSGSLHSSTLYSIKREVHQALTLAFLCKSNETCVSSASYCFLSPSN